MNPSAGSGQAVAPEVTRGRGAVERKVTAVRLLTSAATKRFMERFHEQNARAMGTMNRGDFEDEDEDEDEARFMERALKHGSWREPTSKLDAPWGP